MRLRYYADHKDNQQTVQPNNAIQSSPLLSCCDISEEKVLGPAEAGVAVPYICCGSMLFP